MTQKILLLDKDGTLANTKSGAKFINDDPEDQQIISGMKESLELAKEQGYKIGVASNQLGVAKNYKSLENAIKEFLYLGELLPQIELAVFCPDAGETMTRVSYELNNVFTSQRDVWQMRINRLDVLDFIGEGLQSFRKPDVGMLQYLLAYFNYKPKVDKVIYVGDRDEDCEAARNLGIKFIWASAFAENYHLFI